MWWECEADIACDQKKANTKWNISKWKGLKHFWHFLRLSWYSYLICQKYIPFRENEVVGFCFMWSMSTKVVSFHYQIHIKTSYLKLENYQLMLYWIFRTGRFLRETATLSFTVKYQNSLSSTKTCFAYNMNWTRVGPKSGLSFQTRYLLVNLYSSFTSYLLSKLKPKTRI